MILDTQCAIATGPSVEDVLDRIGHRLCYFCLYGPDNGYLLGFTLRYIRVHIDCMLHRRNEMDVLGIT
jgi:hypothetical protein